MRDVGGETDRLDDSSKLLTHIDNIHIMYYVF